MKISNYSKSEIMKKAWSLVKAGKWSKIGGALTEAWYIARNKANRTVQSLKSELVNSFTFYNSNEKTEAIAYIKLIGLQATGFVFDVCNTVLKYGKCSEKQAYVIANFAFNAGI